MLSVMFITKGGSKPPPSSHASFGTTLPQFHSFFSENLAKLYVGSLPTGGLAPPPTEILDPHLITCQSDETLSCRYRQYVNKNNN